MLDEFLSQRGSWQVQEMLALSSLERALHDAQAGREKTEARGDETSRAVDARALVKIFGEWRSSIAVNNLHKDPLFDGVVMDDQEIEDLYERMKRKRVRYNLQV